MDQRTRCRSGVSRVPGPATLVDELRSLNGHPRRIPARQDVYHEADRVRHLHYVTRGLLYCYHDLPDGGRQITLLHRAGDLIGLSDLHSDTATHSLRTVVDCELLAVPKTALRKCDGTLPRLSECMLQGLARNQQVLSRMLMATGRQNARCRIMTLMLLLHEMQPGGPTGDAPVLDLPLSQAEIGDLTGLTNVSVSKILCDLSESGHIERRGPRIVLRRLKDMRAITGYVPLACGAPAPRTASAGEPVEPPAPASPSGAAAATK